MIAINVVLFTVLPLIMGATGRCICPSIQDEIKAANICNDEDHKEVQKRLGEIQDENKNLEQKIDFIYIMLNQQNTIQRSELNEIKSTLKFSESKISLDEKQHSELKNDLDDMKTTLKTVLYQITSENKAQNELKNKLEELQSLDEQQGGIKNLAQKFDSLNTMLNQQHKKCRSELSVLEDIKLALKTELSKISQENQSQYTIQTKNILEESKSILKSKISSDTTRESELNNDLIEIKSTLKSLESRSISDKIQQSELKNDLVDIKTTLKTVLSEITSQNKAQNELKNEFKESQLVWKNELIEIKSTLKSSEYRIFPDEIQQNERKNDLKEIELALITEVSQIVSDKFDNFTNNCKQIEKIGNVTTIKKSLPGNCDGALQKGGESGVYKVKIPNSDLEAFDVYCLAHDSNDYPISCKNATAWMVIQRREDGSVDFYRNWTDYQQGFGSLKGEFFIGLDKLYALTQSTSHELWIQMETTNGKKLWAKYGRFAIAGASDAYALNVLGTYTGNSDDWLDYHKGMKWTTKDVDNDKNEGGSCAVEYHGAWWYNKCHRSNLNGLYNGSGYKGIQWGAEVLKYVQMAIRPAA